MFEARVTLGAPIKAIVTPDTWEFAGAWKINLVTLIRNFLTWDLTQEEQETQFPSGSERTDCWQGKMLCFPPPGCEHPRVLLRWTLQCLVRVPGILSGSSENFTQP